MSAQARVAENIWWLTEEAELSLRTLAPLAGVSRQTLDNWKTGATEPTLGNLEKVAEVLGVDVPDLFLDHKDFKRKVKKEGVRDFVLGRPKHLSRNGHTSGGSIGRCIEPPSVQRFSRPRHPGIG